MKKKFSGNIDPFVLIFVVILLSGIFSFIISPGELTDGVYVPLPRNRVGFNTVFNIFRSIPMGLKDTSNLVILILIIGGCMEIYKKTGAINAGVSVLIRTVGKKTKDLLLILLITVFSAMGGFLGWIEVLIPFCPLVVAVVLALGYDALTAVAVVIVGSMAGFMAGPTNLYTVAVCNTILQDLGYLDIEASAFIGFSFRLILWLLITAVSTAYIFLYARRVRKDPSKSLVAGCEEPEAAVPGEKTAFTWRQVFVLLTILTIMVMTVIGMQTGIGGVKWAIDDVSAAFLVSALLSGAICRIKAHTFAEAFADGMRSAVKGALIVGLARAVYWIGNTSNISDTIVYQATQLLKGLPPLVAAFGIVVLVSVINGLIPSGSGKGMLLGPILFPVAMELGITPQTVVLAYQFGDGITNMFWFSYGTLMILLQYGRVPIQKWWRFFTPLMLIFFLIAFGVLAVASGMGL